MPYIAQEKRDVLDPIVRDLLRAIRDLQLDSEKDNMEGNLNYFMSVVLDQLYSSNYAAVNNAMGLMNCIAAEFYQRVAVPYEAQKAFENGDVYGDSRTFQPLPPTLTEPMTVEVTE